MSDWVSDVCSSDLDDSRMNLPSQATANPGGRSNAMAAFAAVTVLFFAWGFITSLIDPLVAAVKGIFTLSDAEAQLSASAFFFAYGLMSRSEERRVGKECVSSCRSRWWPLL